MENIEEFKQKFPFISGIRYAGEEYIGIILNSNDKILSFYDFALIKNEEEKKKILDLGDLWWGESNRLIPISIFLSGQLKSYRYCLRTITMKDTEILFGPVTSLNNIVKRRIKRRQIQLIKKV